MILLERRVTRRYQARYRFCLVANRVSSRTEVQQYGAIVVTDKNVGRLDVAVNNPGIVYLREPVEDWQQYAEQALLAEMFALVDQRFQVYPALEVHDDVAGIVVLEKTVYPDNVGMFEASQGLCFLQESLQPPAIDLGLIFRNWLHRFRRIPGRKLDRQVFLDRDLVFQVGVVGEVGDAESALAENRLDFVPEQAGVRIKRIVMFFRIHGLQAITGAESIISAAFKVNQLGTVTLGEGLPQADFSVAVQDKFFPA
ncbi:MAG: hypothetical protein QNJ85_18180 [Gammaproteobacteria bacterium]|nr:hypothetical protein [Gammaproteobacteria bacterium]